MKRTSTTIDFWFFNFPLEYFKIFQRSEQLHAEMNPTSACSNHGLHIILSSYWLEHFYFMKNPPKCCSILVLIAGCWNSLLMSCNLKNNWCLSRIFGSRFRGKDDRGLITCKPWSKQAGCWIHFCTKQLRTLNSFIKYSRSKIKK